MAVIGFDHVQIAIPEGGEDAMRGFMALLGLVEVPKPATLSVSGCWFEGGVVSLHVGVDPDFHPAEKAHPALLVDDLDGLRERLDAGGFATREDKPLANYRRFFTSDPFGNRFELMQRV